MPLANGDRLGEYVLAAPMGNGEFGPAWKAERADRPGEFVTIQQLLQPTLIAALKEADPAADPVRHPNIIQIIGSDLSGPAPYIVTEHLTGKSLARALAERHRLSTNDSLAVVRPVLAALAAGHERGLAHMDVRPANILLSPGGRVSLSDFGLARATAAATEAARKTGAYGDGDMRRLGERLRYMPPEQIAGDPPGITGDLYALGIILHEMLAGDSRRLRFPIPFVKEHASDAAERATRPDPAERFAGAADFLKALDAPPEPPAGAAPAPVPTTVMSGVMDPLLADAEPVPVPPPAADPYRLFLMDDPNHPAKPLRKEVTVFGSRPGVSVRLLAAEISDTHCCITRLPTGYVLSDLGSDTGTLLNGKPVKAAVLRDGDQIQIGQHRFRFAK